MNRNDTDAHDPNISRLSPDSFYTTAEVAAIFRVDPYTVARWVKTGKISGVRTPGGQYRIPGREIGEMIAGVRTETI
jgi:excisionase family DNA binding protein